MKTAKIVWNETDTPVSSEFDDVYFSNDDAIAETTYVFIEGNQLNDRFLKHQTSTFVIGETGFGSGLNFLLVWSEFQKFRQSNPNHILTSLEFYSVEKFPLTLFDMQQIHQKIIQSQTLNLLAKQLQKIWPKQHWLFDDVTLDILLADIGLFADHLQKNKIQVDAWFLDGFSPAKNPEMWSETVFRKLKQVTHQNGTFATFTAAGQVKRNLVNAGFNVYKRKGFGKKREMLIGHL